MKVALVFVLLFATVLCRPAKNAFMSSESSEEVRRQPAAPALEILAEVAAQNRPAQVQDIVAPASTSSDESTDASEEDQQMAAEAPLEVQSDITAFSSDAASLNSNNAEDSDGDDDDDDDDDDETEENETEEDEDEDESSNSSESGETSTPAPTTLSPVIGTEEPVAETTVETIEPTIVTDTGRGDSLGGYPDEYKSIIYVEDKSYHKAPFPYKSYELVGTGKKMAYEMKHGNEVEKSMQVYKVHSDVLEDDSSTPEVESQGLDISLSSQDHASLSQEGDSASTSDAATSESNSSSNPEEEEMEEEESTSNASDESEDEDSQDSVSDESDSAESDSDEGTGGDTTTDTPLVITAK